MFQEDTCTELEVLSWSACKLYHLPRDLAGRMNWSLSRKGIPPPVCHIQLAEFLTKSFLLISGHADQHFSSWLQLRTSKRVVI